MEKYTKDDLMHLIENSNEGDLSKKYLSWKKLDNNDFLKFKYLGIISVEHNYDAEFPSKENYWSPKYPIALEYYPYYGCEIFTDEMDFFFIYNEFGGHVPEKRCRCIKKDLII